jgi:hypothetical protein
MGGNGDRRALSQPSVRPVESVSNGGHFLGVFQSGFRKNLAKIGGLRQSTYDPFSNSKLTGKDDFFVGHRLNCIDCAVTVGNELRVQIRTPFANSLTATGAARSPIPRA